MVGLFILTQGFAQLHENLSFTLNKDRFPALMVIEESLKESLQGQKANKSTFIIWVWFEATLVIVGASNTSTFYPTA